MNDDQTGQAPAGEEPREDGGAQGGGREGGPPGEEELRAAFEEQMRHIRVEDVLLQTTATLVNLAARRLGLATEPGQESSGERDVEQARLAIDGVRALVPLCPAEQAEPIRQALSQLQMAFAREAQAGGGTAQPPGAEQDDEEAERAKARAKIWTPPGA